MWARGERTDMNTTTGSVPETILPDQFFTQHAAMGTPEKRLIFAVLLDAITQLRRGGEVDAGEAARWIRQESEGAPISFADACDALGFEPHGLARGLLAVGAEGGANGVLGRELPRVQQRVATPGRLRPCVVGKGVRPRA